jgi:hypothetical protein
VSPANLPSTILDKAVTPARRAWARLSQVTITTNWERGETEKGGIHLGYAHSDPRCHYLRHKAGEVGHYEVIELTGPILERVRWCSKCTPAPAPSVTADVTIRSLNAAKSTPEDACLRSAFQAPAPLSTPGRLLLPPASAVARSK